MLDRRFKLRSSKNETPGDSYIKSIPISYFKAAFCINFFNFFDAFFSYFSKTLQVFSKSEKTEISSSAKIILNPGSN